MADHADHAHPAHSAAYDDHAHDVDRNVRAALVVFGALIVLTFVTVGAYYVHLPHAAAIVLALTIATFKAGLVAAYFMHLISERKLIYTVLLITVGLFFVLLLLPMLTSISDHLGYQEFS